jgi:hypothetical protein
LTIIEGDGQLGAREVLAPAVREAFFQIDVHSRAPLLIDAFLCHVRVLASLEDLRDLRDDSFPRAPGYGRTYLGFIRATENLGGLFQLEKLDAIPLMIR